MEQDDGAGWYVEVVQDRAKFGKRRGGRAVNRDGWRSIPEGRTGGQTGEERQRGKKIH